MHFLTNPNAKVKTMKTLEENKDFPEADRGALKETPLSYIWMAYRHLAHARQMPYAGLCPNPQELSTAISIKEKYDK